MSMLDWAKREVELACKNERGDNEPYERDYTTACYESALKAFESLVGDRHSGMSISITKHILNRLIDHKPLTPIEDTEDTWNRFLKSDDGVEHYQCRRMSSLFKHVYPDGTIKYTDVDRVVGEERLDNGYCYRNGIISEIVDDLFPITMPYVPEAKPYRVFTETFLYDENNGDFDTIAIIYIKTPDDTIIDVSKYYKEGEDDFIEISEEEYFERKEAYLNGQKTDSQH